VIQQYLFAAEADRIQDWLFRASRLREVVGGSQLLSKFCKKIKKELQQKWKLTDDQILVCDGGAFRLCFHDEVACRDFGRALSDEYFVETGGTLSVADEFPVFDPNNSASFTTANAVAHTALRRAKARGIPTIASAHLPLIGVCASCGSGLAWIFAGLPDVPREVKNYLCRECEQKANRQNRRGFLKQFETIISGLENDETRKTLQCTLKPEVIGRLDQRGYVAYLKADGNAFGELFQRCENPAVLKELSAELTNILWQSLAEPGRLMLETLENAARKKTRNAKPTGDSIPLLPLIVAGDECFFLLPAPWSLDFASRFCLAFEERMATLVEKLNLVRAGEKATLSAAIVICKATYPHKLAHRRAERLIALAKQHSRQSDAMTSLICFEVVQGSSMVNDGAVGENGYRCSMQPYGASDDSKSETLSLDRLTKARDDLRRLPKTPLQKMRALFDEPPASPADVDDWWSPKLRRVLDRVGRLEADAPADQNGLTEHESKGHRQRLQDALSALSLDGTKEGGYWGRAKRDNFSTYLQGFPDLIGAWRYACPIDQPAVEDPED